MNAIALTPVSRPQPLLSAGARIAAGLAVAAFVAFAWSWAGHASHQAVQVTSIALGAPATL